MSKERQLLDEFVQIKKEMQEMGKDIEACFCTLIEQIKGEFDHFSKGIQKALFGVQNALTGASEEMDELQEESPKDKPVNLIFFV